MTDPDDIPPAVRIGPNGETALELSRAMIKRAFGVDVPVGPIETNANPALDPVIAEPAFASRFGRAWLCDADAARAVDKRPDGQGTVGAWIVEAPWANCMWHSYMVCVIHLRPIPGVAAPVIHLPGATHEMMVIALDPRSRREDTITHGKGAAMLTPLNFVGQFIAPNDAAAFERVERDVLDIVQGDLNPDTDSRSSWVKRYGSACLRR